VSAMTTAVRFLCGIAAATARTSLTTLERLVVSRAFTSWNQMAAWLRAVDRLGHVG
jgi:hypothetical protein